MTKNTNELAARAGDSAASADKTKATAKTRRPRRMAREKGASIKPVEAALPPAKPTSQPRGESKMASVIALLSREQGATLLELVEATGWLPHTTRAALTRLRKKGHVIAKTTREGTTCYHIAQAA